MRLPTLLLVLVAVALSGCTTAPVPGAEPVTGFELDRYLGTWYEIARLDHTFERGLENVTANYTLNDDGSVRVLNRGYDVDKGDWDTAVGRARFQGDPGTASLEVSFFGPFYAGYHVIDLDPEAQDYGHALVVSSTRGFLWILARQPELDAATYDRLVAKAAALGINTDGLIRVDHTPRDGA